MYKLGYRGKVDLICVEETPGMDYYKDHLFALSRFRIDGWITCNFTSFSTVFQSYKDDGRVIVKDCAQLNPIYG